MAKVKKYVKPQNTRCHQLQLQCFFFPREPQKNAREHFQKSAREYFACAREYKKQNVPVNGRSAREPSKKCP